MSRDSDSMSSCRIERKRAHDREAQRASRAKTKAYIAHLEKTVADLSENSGDGRANYLATHASQQQNEIDSLQNLLGKIRTLVHDASKAEQNQISPPTRLKTESTSDSGIGTEETAGEHFTPTWDSPPSEDNWNDFGKLAQREDKKAAAAKPVLSTRNLTVLGINMLCEDIDDCSYFTRLNEAVTKVEQTPDNLSTLEEDEDILIRAIVHGWDASERIHHFDIVWRFLRAFDEGLWYRAAPLERFAHFWQMRSTMLHKIQPKNQPRRRTAPFMAPTLGQKSLLSRPAIVDYFGWPQVRNHLLTQGIGNCTGTSSIAFAESFRFVWPYELRDVYRINKATGLFSLSEAFLKSSHDLSCFRMLQNDAIPYYVHPSLAQAVAPPTFNSTAAPVESSDASDASDDGDVPSTTTAMATTATTTTSFPHIEALMQEAAEASWIPPFSIDGMDLSGSNVFDPFSMVYEAGMNQWPVV